MQTRNRLALHSDFRWNGQKVSVDDLVTKASQYYSKGADFEREIGAFILEWFSNSDTIVLTTSGTTGYSKNIEVSKQSMINSALATGVFFDLKPSDAALLCLPVKYIGGKMMLVRSFVLGLQMDNVAPSSTPLKGINKKYDFIAMVPMQVEQSIRNLNGVKKVIIGGAKISESLKNQLLLVPNSIYETYGMTETVSHIAAKKIQDPFFTILPNISIFKDDRGCLVINAPHISKEPVVTNDLVDLVSETQFSYIGRIDSVINSGGVKLFPEAIESKLSVHIKERFFLIESPDSLLGQKVVLVVEGPKKDLDDTIFAQLTPFEKPKEIRFVPKFKETESGKIMRKATFDYDGLG
jgi:O-succinylbenzoic acid--CoA ligase